MSIELAFLVLVTALLVMITAQLRAIAVMIRETIDASEFANDHARQAFANDAALIAAAAEVHEHSHNLTLVN